MWKWWERAVCGNWNQLQTQQETGWESWEMYILYFESSSNLSSYMRGMATLQTFEELPCKEPESPDVRKHLHFCLSVKDTQKQ